MVTIEQSPDPVSLAGNPICFTVAGGNALESTPSGKAKATLRLEQELQAGQGFYLQVNEDKFRFLVTAYQEDVEDSGMLVLPSGATSMGAVEVATQLKEHPFFAAHFSITAQTASGQESVLMEAIDGERYVLQLSFSNTNPDGEEMDYAYVLLEQEAYGGYPDIKEGYSLHRTVLVQNGARKEEAVSEDVLPVDNEGRCKSDISEFLQPYFSFELQYPVEYPVKAASGMIVAYRCCFHEEVGGMITRRTESDLLHALPGRMSALDYAVKTSLGESPCDGVGYRFLSNYTGTKKVYPDYPEKLFFLIPESDKTYLYSLKASVRCRDSQIESTIGTGISTKRPNMMECNVDYASVRGAASSLADADSYTVWVERRELTSVGSVPERVSEKREFRVERENPANLHCFFFINAWGVPEVAVLRGFRRTELDISREINEVKGEEAAQSPLSVQIDKNITVGSGYVSKDEWEWLCEMQRSLQVFELLPNRILACTLNNQKSSKVDEFGLYSHEFTYKHAKEGSRAFEGGFSYRYLFDSTFDATFN